MTQILRDAREATTATEFGDLPNWDLTDLYPAEDAPELARDLDWLGKECAAFNADYAGKLADLDAAALLACVRRYEQISAITGRIMSFAGLRYYQNTTDQNRSKFFSDMQAKVNDFTTHLVFFSLEMNRIPDATLDGHIAANADLARYKPILDRMRKMRPHQLSDELETFLHDQGVVGAAAWNRLFDETMAALTFDVDGETLPLEATLNLLSDHDRARRETGARALAEVLQKNTPLFARITNTLAKEKEIEDRWRKLPTPQASRHLANDVEPEVVQALRDAVVKAYPDISHRYYAMKAKMLGAGQAGGLGPQRAAPDRDAEDRRLDASQVDCPRRLCRLRPPHGRDRSPLLRQGLDRRRRQTRQGPRCVCPSDGDGCAPLRPAELPRQTPRRDDPGP